VDAIFHWKSLGLGGSPANINLHSCLKTKVCEQVFKTGKCLKFWPRILSQAHNSTGNEEVLQSDNAILALGDR
jgi:hypothetical protein